MGYGFAMCGRLTLTANTVAKVKDLLPDVVVDAWMGPRYNVAPAQPVPVVRAGVPRRVEWLSWGLIPGWASDRAIANRLINARSESVADKPAFREAWKHRRCVVLADGFYEWKTDGNNKTPWHFYFPGHPLFAIAGLWESWFDAEANVQVDTCTVLTTEANALMKPIHHRMPVILGASSIDAWIGEGATPAERAALLRACPAPGLQKIPVDRAVNHTGNDHPGLIEPVPEPPEQGLLAW